ncbi:MAG: TolC family protein [Gammaproteobacteria bacterium]
MIPKTFFARRDWALILWLSTISGFSYAAERPPFEGREAFSPKVLVAAVLSRNPSLPAIEAALEAAGSRSDRVSALEDPRLSYGIAPQTVGVAGLDFGQKIELSQAVPWPGKLDLQGAAARYEADSVREDIETLRLTLAALAKSLYADWYFFHRAIAINRSNQVLLEEFRDIALTRYSTGLATKQDALQAEVEINLLKHQAIVLERERKTILARINTLLNRPPEDPLPVPQKLVEPELPGDSASFREKASNSRPELRALTARIRSLDALSELAERDVYPDFNFSAGYNSLWDRREKRFTVGVGFNIPLDQSKRRANEAEARARLKIAQWDGIDLAAKIAEEVEVAYQKVQESRHVLELYRGELVPLAEENLEAAQADYQAGLGEFFSLISAEKNLLQTRLQTERALADAHQRMAELERAVGGFEADLAAGTLGSTEP